jgi:hypothetical protein
MLRDVRRATGARTNSEAVRRALEQAQQEEIEKQKMRRFLKKWGGKGKAGDFKVLEDEARARRHP